jgi:hypothetical protein
MKMKFYFLGIFALSMLALAAPHGWMLKTGGKIEGDYFTSGSTTVVVKRGGTNCLIKISDLATNELPYLAEMQAAQKHARLDAEARQMAASGMIEFTSDMIQHFPEKAASKNGWMDAEFDDFNSTGGRNSEMDLGFYVKDSQGKLFPNCCVSREIYGPDFLNDSSQIKPNPMVDVISQLKKGDKVRFIGRVDGGSDSYYPTYHFFVDQIEIIETAAEKKAREDAADKNSDTSQ